MEKLNVREGNTGILYLKDERGKQERYIPNYDLDKARELLLEFQQQLDKEGRCIRNNYWHEGYNWFPTVINYLYGIAFFGYVKYKPLIDRIIDGELKVQFENWGNFRNLVGLLQGRDKGNFLKKRILNLLLSMNNKTVIRKYAAELLLFNFAPDDFRTARVKKILEDLSVAYIEVIAPAKKLLLKNILGRKPYYFFGGIPSRNIFDHEYDVQGDNRYKKILFAKAIRKIEWMISGFVREYKKHRAILEAADVKTFYGIDDTQAVYPLLYACQQRRIHTIAHQHGAAYNKRHASYIMEGIERESYKWFDKIIVWGSYWKDRLLALSKVYSPDMFIVGSNLFGFSYPKDGRQNSDHRNVLIPYEFLTNTYKVGRYMVKLIDLGYRIFFKPRTDEDLNAQLDAYCLPKDYLEKITIVQDLTPDFINQIDIVAGTMTTMVYQFLPCRKIIWVFDTEYRYLDDLVEEGFAHKVSYEDLEALDGRLFARTEVDEEYLFCSETLQETISKHVLNPLKKEA